jgi:V8-like Glu-specific endopeptidase
LPDSWLKARDRLNLDTPFNLSSNNDIVGGNSGSSMVNARGEVVGLVFDGNIHSISGSYWFDTARNRAVSVHPAIMKLALTQVYDTAALAAELGIKR